MSDKFHLYLDKSTDFECRLELEGASLKDTTARLIVEAPDMTLLFTGVVRPDGTCSVPVGKMRGVLGENTEGTVRLEVIAEDSYFQPWNADFVVSQSKRLTVETVQNQTPKKASVRVQMPSTPAPSAKKPAVLTEEVTPTTRLITEVVKTLRSKGITPANAVRNKEYIHSVIEEHVSNVTIDELLEMDLNGIIKRVVTTLANK